MSSPPAEEDHGTKTVPWLVSFSAMLENIFDGYSGFRGGRAVARHDVESEAWRVDRPPALFSQAEEESAAPPRREGGIRKPDWRELRVGEPKPQPIKGGFHEQR